MDGFRDSESGFFISCQLSTLFPTWSVSDALPFAFTIDFPFLSPSLSACHFCPLLSSPAAAPCILRSFWSSRELGSARGQVGGGPSPHGVTALLLRVTRVSTAEGYPIRLYRATSSAQRTVACSCGVPCRESSLRRSIVGYTPQRLLFRSRLKRQPCCRFACSRGMVPWSNVQHGVAFMAAKEL